MDMMDYPTTDAYTKADIARVQTILFEMAKIIAEALDRHGVKYMISFGSLLGALRHDGFIPWDDDFDFMILEDNYEEAVRSITDDLPDWIAVQSQDTDPNYLPSWTTLVDKSTEAYSENDGGHALLKYRGVRVDLFRATRCQLSKVKEIRLLEAIDYYERKRGLPNAITEEVYRERIEPLKEQLESLRLQPEVLADDPEVYTFVSSRISKYHCGDIFPLKRYTFNGAEFWGPNNADALLTESYGDWRSMPEYSKRIKHYRRVSFMKTDGVI